MRFIGVSATVLLGAIAVWQTLLSNVQIKWFVHLPIWLILCLLLVNSLARLVSALIKTRKPVHAGKSALMGSTYLRSPSSAVNPVKPLAVVYVVVTLTTGVTLAILESAIYELPVDLPRLALNLCFGLMYISGGSLLIFLTDFALIKLSASA